MLSLAHSGRKNNRFSEFTKFYLKDKNWLYLKKNFQPVPFARFFENILQIRERLVWILQKLLTS